MPKFIKFMNENSGQYYLIRIDPSVTTRQLVINKLSELDGGISIGNKFSKSMIWVKTNTQKSKIESLTGINYVTTIDSSDFKIGGLK